MEETRLKIKLFGEPVLRKKVKPVKGLTPFHRDILSAMAQLMYASAGIGLAASQVGISEAMLVVDVGHCLYKLVNPKIVRRQGQQVMEEGCLSLPGVGVKVKRAKKVFLKAEDENGKPLNIDAEGLLACVLQHEIDHLNGRLIIDYASWADRIRMKKELKIITQRAENEGMPKTETKSPQL